MPTFHDTYVGYSEETVYGTFVAPTNFVEFVSEGVSGKYERIESEGLRSGNQVLRSDRWAVNPKGAEGDLKLECLDVGLDLFLKHALGSISAGLPTGGFTVHTATLGDLKGKSLSVKIGRVDAGGAIRPFDYTGGKIKSWELSNSVDGIAMLSLDMDFATTVTAGAAATPAYPALSAQLFTFVSGAVTIGGTSFAVADFSLKGDNKLKTDRYALRGASSTAKREPLAEGLRDLTFDIKGEFEDLTQVNRVASATAGGATAAIVATWDTPQGGQLSVSIPFGRFDEHSFNVDGAKILDLGLTGKVTTDGTAQPITVTYKAKSA